MKHLRFFCLAVLCCLYLATANSQQHICGDQLLKHSAELKYPGINKAINQSFLNAKQATTFKRQELLTIPVVVHVIYNNDEQNVSDALINEQIDILNQHFNPADDSYDSVRAIFQDLATNPQIAFELAQLDPDGNPTTGITRTPTDMESFIDIDIFALITAFTECGSDINDPAVQECLDMALGDLDLDAMKRAETGGVDPWDTDRYLNIWVCNLSIEFAGMSSPFILGFAYPPLEAPNWPPDTVPADIEDIDGVVITTQAWGLSNPANAGLEGIADMGLTCVHEVGHYLGLRHIWGDGDCDTDDGLEDTPAANDNSQPSEQPLPTCDELYSKNSCELDSLPDMIENYMDYSIESCQQMFTAQQVGIMRAMLEGPRSGLVEGQISSTAEIAPDWFSIAPNPAQDWLYLNVDRSQDYQVDIIDTEGRIITSGAVEPSIDIAQLTAGLYWIRLSGNGDVGLRKFMKL